jgi:hypothetical protein
VKEEIVARMENLVRRMAASRSESDGPTRYCYRDYAEAVNITELLPAPVDPDLIEARDLSATMYEEPGSPFRDAKMQAAECRLGLRDKTVEVRAALKAIKRGRELQGAAA